MDTRQAVTSAAADPTRWRGAVAAIPATLPARLERAGTALGRYGVALVLAWIGLMKFTPAEAEGIRGLIEHSPLMSWMYAVWSVQGASKVIGAVEIAAALLIAARAFSPRAAVVGSAVATLTFITTLSFMATTPGVFQVADGFVQLSGSGQFLIKDVVLLGASLWSLGEALEAVRRGGPGARAGVEDA